MQQTLATKLLTAEESTSAVLAEFVSKLRYEELPQNVVARTEEAFLDWFGCALAGRTSRAVAALENFTYLMGPGGGPSQILVSRRRTSPFFAALVNGASSHVVEQDDVHNGAMFHPGTVVFSAVLAAAQHACLSGKEFITSAVAGYEVAVRTGEFLGPDHYKIFHTTGTAGVIGAAAGVARLLGLDPNRTLDSLGTAGTQAAALWEFLRDGADSKLLHSGKAAADGLLSAYLARDGFTGASHILEGEQGLAAALSRGGATAPGKIVEQLGQRWVVLECTYKPYACCRHTHPSADALKKAMTEHCLTAEQIARVICHVHPGALEVLGRVKVPKTPYQAKFCLGFVLGLVAVCGHAGVGDFTEGTLADPRISAFSEKVELVPNPEVRRDARVRPGRVEIFTLDGRLITASVPCAKGDPQNPLTRDELDLKAQELAAYSGAARPDEVGHIVSRIWNLHDAPDMSGLYLDHPQDPRAVNPPKGTHI